MLALMTFALALCAQDEPVDVSELLRRLGAEQATTRDDGQRKLEALGAPVAPLLREALARTEDPDTRARLEQILRKVARPARSKQDAKKQVEEMSRALARMQKVLSEKSLSDEEKVAQVLIMTAQVHAAALGGTIVKVEGFETGPEVLSESARQVVDRFHALDRAERDRVVRELVRRQLEAVRAEGDQGLDEVRKLIERMLREAEPPPPEKKKD